LLAYLAVAGAHGPVRRRDTLLGAPSRSDHQEVEVFHRSHHASAATPRGICGGKTGTSSLRSLSALGLLGGILASGASGFSSVLPVVQTNRNVERAGVLHDGVLTVALEAKASSWRTNGPDRPPMTIEAFSEPGKQPLIPGPLVRAPQGTEIRFSVRNAFPTPLTFFLPAAIHGGPDRATAMDSIVVAPGAVGQLATKATVPGNYVYRAATLVGPKRITVLTGLLAGALVVDTAGAPARPRDRVFVIMATTDSAGVIWFSRAVKRTIYTINGRSWPNTEHIPATVGDSLHWRVINASTLPHPMHLHGFYYRVDAFSGPSTEIQGRPSPGQMVVTQFLSAFSGMSMSWSPSRPGTWLFHCHLAIHNMPDSISAEPGDPYMRAMIGLILSVNVANRPGVRAAGDPAPTRHLRLVAVTGPDVVGEGPDGVSSMHFVLEEQGHHVDTGRDASPEVDLTRGEPVSIMIVSHLREPTSVHWHGIEVEDSYMDGVPGVSGEGTRLTPAIAPGDSFEARFTPPRSGTFMYHAHMDEAREEIGGLEGALIVRDPGESPSPDDHAFLYKGFGPSRVHPLEIDGEANPDTVVLHVGHAARLRFLSLATTSFNPTFSLTARLDSALTIGDDTMIVRWRPVAKDGFDLPLAAQTPRAAQQIVSIGETYDFEYTPQRKGMLRLEVRSTPDPAAVPRGGKRLLIRVPIRVE